MRVRVFANVDNVFVGKTAAPSHMRAKEAPHSEDVDSHDKQSRCFLPGSAKVIRDSVCLFISMN